MADQYTLRLPALEVRQGRRRIYCFAVDGKKLHSFAAVSRIRRDEDEQLLGYQRPEVLSHIRSIRRYLESDGAMLPNAIVVAFDSRVEFVPSLMQGEQVDYSVLGELVIPVDETLPENDKPAWLVDGQQRSAAIRDANIAEFPVAVVGFITDAEEEQRSQFILVNSTRALPKGLIHELLPNTSGQLPAAYLKRKLPAELMTRLNGQRRSPFYRRIATPTAPNGYIKDNSVLKMLEHSLFNGSLFQYRDPSDGSGDVKAILDHLVLFWSVVRDVFQEEWRKPPKDSRLTHGVGIQSLGFIMDELTEDIPVERIKEDEIRKAVESLKPHVAWTSGVWKFGEGEERKWNNLQNTPNDVKQLTEYLKKIVNRGLKKRAR
ncbi:DGQHR domain-containing protein DpdB [Crossiella sp. CA-258035]|uniref:DGQHR domain-containing protein DpdB n=1 Tax=Crossiella sp. CA-258035 TaxID=2981138 RepID=UPI0024BC50FA|nr:DGQHR domain-containing protein DpdB [Crossiella sp. CA-258035]WHT20543.1 DGQHR domain-containing protein DpdB [Crossiella sp. CA-258035]